MPIEPADPTTMLIQHGDGYSAHYIIRPGKVSVMLTAPCGRQWHGEKTDIDEAIQLAKLMYLNRQANDASDKAAAARLFAVDFEVKDAEIARLKRKIQTLQTEHGKRQ